MNKKLFSLYIRILKENTVAFHKKDIKQIKSLKNQKISLYKMLCGLQHNCDAYFTFTKYLWDEIFKKIFLKFCEKYKLLSINNYVIDISRLSKTSPYNYFALTFNWCKTSEGFRFWQKINQKWTQKIAPILAKEF